MQRLRVAAVLSLALLASCGSADPLGAWSGSAAGGESGGSRIWGISEISDSLPRVKRQIGPGGPIRSFAERPENGLIARARVTEVEPWYSIVRDLTVPEDEVRNIPKHKAVDYGADGALWSTTQVTIDIADDYGEPDFDAPRLTVEAWGLVEDFEAYVGSDVIITAGKEFAFYATNGVFELEWRLLSISPINADGSITWPDDYPVGRSTTIEAFERIARRGEIVVTRDESNPPEVIERRRP